MADADLEAGLKSLRKSLQQLKSLIAWEQLKQSEARPGQPLSFQIHDSVETDLRNEYSFFLFTSLQMHRILNRDTPGVSVTKQQHIKEELTKIERRLNSLNLSKRFSQTVAANKEK